MALRKPPLREAHAARDAKFTEFGGWDMPVEFDSIRTEHTAVRESVGIFDVSHMGEIEVSGPDATRLMQRLTTNDVTLLDPGDSQYAMITDAEGTILDDTVVYRLPDEETDRYLFIPNAGHDEEMHDRWTSHRDEWELDARIANTTEEWAMFAVQGPDAKDAVVAAADGDVGSLSKFEATYEDVVGVRSWVARTGYTGEDGFEILCPVEEAETVWNAFVEDHESQPCGLGARDTLRMEMGFLLSGEDFDPESEPRNPYEAGVGFTVKLDTEFVGRDALEGIDEEGVEEKFVGLKLLDRGVPRHGYDIVDADNHVVGHVTSGTMSPTLGEPIALGYVPVEHADPGTTLSVVVRGQEKRAKVVSTPFLEDK
ncbi:glycine cleavage system aminomethyltransferase T [Halogeometricum borinquense DSM 11551]|uniref:Probable aminomethyltransferase n=2 Tax=Halogeometricum borinquense TaxID=60847 RepID=E4NP03_HALBP|nr:glycine cleavage system aminomethyltransferase GcvT [Halogeometricum borinquense]ADQ66434.1 aminomethyltransferase [Halogeometricum borinquense DSM 11551]ELY31154.1 glycine cleavage system aminomethyltransferase T [Halogeometricum borinquense DSM 11551]RYJ15169.1 glycine cleavage system aminomethyltransferase GcvT [Halogeometricum borinquense]